MTACGMAYRSLTVAAQYAAFVFARVFAFARVIAFARPLVFAQRYRAATVRERFGREEATG